MKKRVLLVTDFYYQAKGRTYYLEDLELSQFLKKYFTVHIAHIEDAQQLADHVDLLLLRNTGPQALHKEPLQALQTRRGLLLFNDLLGKGDIKGKQHLLDLYTEGYSVIPTFTKKADCPPVERYLVKPLDGADSCGVQVATWDTLQESYPNMLIQPLLPFLYEVSFYFINSTFYYALYTPDPKNRWHLEPYAATDEDVAFAASFIKWNSCRRGIQRVDACRTLDGKLLLMELEDYNPFLSLDALPKDVKENFLEALCSSVRAAIDECSSV